MIADFQRTWQSFDLDGSGIVDEQEFATVLCNLNSYWTADKVHQLLEYFDTNRDGQLQEHEFFCWLFDERRWVKNESTSKPGKFYYTNLDTYDKTWHWNAKARVTVYNALNLCGTPKIRTNQDGKTIKEFSPYAKVHFLAREDAPSDDTNELRTSVLEDAGRNPNWSSLGMSDLGTLRYKGGNLLEFSVWSYNGSDADDDLIGSGVVEVEQFYNGFQGEVPISLPSNRDQDTGSISVGIMWHSTHAAHLQKSSSKGKQEALPPPPPPEQEENESYENESYAVGKGVPDFKFNLLGGTEVNFHDWRGGKPVLIDFYAPW